MYDESFRNQAVKECVNGQSSRSTARKYGVSDTALRSWVKEYKKRMAEMSRSEHKIKTENEEADVVVEEAQVVAKEADVVVKESAVRLKSVNIYVDGHNITMSKRDVIKLMKIFYQFDKQEGRRDDM